jgi:hypothetical protein
VYGWVILIVLIVLVMVYYSGYLNVTRMFPPYCNFIPTLSCYTFKFGSTQDGRAMALSFKLVNGLGYDIKLDPNSTVLLVENIGKLGRNQYNTTCRSKGAIIKQGDPISCNVIIPDNESVPLVGRSLDFKVEFTYGNCNALPNYAKDGNCTGAPQYTVSGSIRTLMELNNIQLYSCGDEICDYSLGENPTNCCADCSVAYLNFTANPSQVDQYTLTDLKVGAVYPDGTPASNATVYFSKSGGWSTSDALISGNDTTNSSITDSAGNATAKYGSGAVGDMILNASSCGPGAIATVRVKVGQAPTNGTIIFTRYPPSTQAGGQYSINATVYDSSGNLARFTDVVLIADPYSTVNPTTATTDLSGIAQVTFSSNVAHVGRLLAQAIGVWNATNPIFSPTGGIFAISNNGPANVSSDAPVDISGCLYDIHGAPVTNANVIITTDLGYFQTSTGNTKLPGLIRFKTERPTTLSGDATSSNARTARVATGGVGFRAFGYNSTCSYSGHTYEIADPVEFDAYAGKFVKIMATSDANANSSTRASTITSYLNLVGTNGRMVYIFYNTSYINQSTGLASWIYPRTFYGNLTLDLTSSGISFQTIGDPQQLRSIMVNNANTTILISANELLPSEVWACETDGGVPKEFFQRGGIQIHTGDWEYYYALNLSGGKLLSQCKDGASGAYYVFGWYTAHYYCDSTYVSPIMVNSMTTANTYGPNGCFNLSTDHPVLYSATAGIATVTGTYSSIYNSTIVNFTSKGCLNGTTYVANGTCFSKNNKPDFCINGFNVSRCLTCYLSCGSPISGKFCDPVSGNCVPNPGNIVLTLKTFNNGNGVQLPNDNYTKLQVIAQVLDASGNLIEGLPITWSTSNVLISSIACQVTQAGCGDYSAPNQPHDPRAVVYVNSNGGWTGNAVVTASADYYGTPLQSSMAIPVYNVFGNKTTNGVRWITTNPTVIPADNNTFSTICTASFNLNDSALGNVSICLNTSIGTFTNGKSLICTATVGGPLYTNQYGEICSMLKSDTPGNANVSVILENETSPGNFINVTYYLPTNITFYPITNSIIITLSQNPVRPSAANSSSSLIINATFKNATNGPIAGIPYVYFYIPYLGYTSTYFGSSFGNLDVPLVSYWGGNLGPYWSPVPNIVNSGGSGSDFMSLRTAYNTGWCETYYRGYPGECWTTTASDGSASSTFSPVYPPGQYYINVSTWYNCSGAPYWPSNCNNSFSNVTLLNVTPTPQSININLPPRPVKPDGLDSLNVSFTLIGSDGNPLPGVYYNGFITCASSLCSMNNPPLYSIPADSEEFQYTNSSGMGYMSNISSYTSGLFNLTFYTYYFSASAYSATGNPWVLIISSTTINFSPFAQTLMVNASPQSAYADGVSSSNITFTVIGSDGNAMNNSIVYINPPTLGSLSCCYGTGCNCTGYTANGAFTTQIYSTNVGDSNVSAYLQYFNGTAVKQIKNSTIVTFKPLPTNVVMSANSTAVNGDGVDTAMIQAQFLDSSGNPTPGAPVQCNISNNGVIYPDSSIIMTADSNGNATVYVSALPITSVTVMCYYGHIGSLVAVGSKNITVNTLGVNKIYNVVLTANQYSALYGSYINVTANITKISDLTPAPPSTPVTFSTSYAGNFSGGANMYTAYTMNGLASALVTAIGPAKIYVKANVSGDWGISNMLNYT